VDSANYGFSSVSAESALPEHLHRFRLSESVSVSGCINDLSFLAISIALQGSHRNDGRSSIVESVNVISPRLQLSPLDRGTVSVLLSGLPTSEGHRLSGTGLAFGFRSSESILESHWLGYFN
jgi:hypothetical protein